MVEETKGLSADMFKNIDMDKITKEVSKAKKQLKQELNLDVNTDKAVKSTEKATKKMREQLKSLNLKNAEDILGLQTQGVKRDIIGISNEFKKLKGQKYGLENIFDAQRFKQQAKEIKRSVDTLKGSFANYNEANILDYINNNELNAKKIKTPDYSFYNKKIKVETEGIEEAKRKLTLLKEPLGSFKGNIKKIKIDTEGTEQAKRKLTPLKAYLDKFSKYKINLGNVQVDFSKLILQIERAKQKVNELKKNLKETSANKLNNSIQQVKKSITASGSSSKKISNGLNSAKNMASKMGGSLKMGLGQILKILGALFGLQTIYSTLTNVANTWLSSQNSQAKQLSANIDYMKYALGSTLAPVIQWIVNLIYQALKGVQSLIYALTGVNIFANASAKAYSNMAGSAKKAKEETKQLAGIHSEISNIQDNNGSDSGSGGAGDVAPNIDLSKVNTKLNNFLKMLKEGKWYEAGVEIGKKINESLEKIPWESIKKKAGDIGKCIAEFLNGGIATTDWKLVGKTLAEGINTAIEFAYSFITTFDWKKFGQSIGDSINGFFENIDWKKAGETIGKGISGIVSTISEFIKTVNWSAVAQSIFDFLIESISNIDWSNIISTIFYLLGLSIGWQLKIAEMVSNWAEELGKQVSGYFAEKIQEAGGNVAKGLWNGILEGLGNIGKWILDNIVNPIIDGFKNAMGIHSPSTVMFELGEYVMQGLLNGITSLIDKVKEKWEEIKTNAVNKFTEIKDTVVSKITEMKDKAVNKVSELKNNTVDSFNNIKNKAIEIWSNIKNSIANKVTEVKDGIKNKFQEAYNGIRNIFGNIGSFFSNVWGNVKNTFSNLGTSIGNAISNSVKSGINGVISMIQNTINRAIGIINGAIRLINKLPGVSVSTVSTLSLPRLAKGGVLYDETAFIGGEYSGARSNPEIVTPQNLMYDTMRRALSDSDIGSSDDRPINLAIYVGNTKVGQILLDNLRDMKRKSGKDIEALIGG